jgi:hypothetical protein
MAERFKYWLGAMVCAPLLSAGVLLSSPAVAQSPSPPATATASKPAFDLTGTWWVTQPEGAAGFKPDPPLKPEAMKVWQEVNRRRAAGENFRDKSGLCLPEGMPLIITRVYPIEVHQTAKMITIIYEYENNVRWIYLDGRPHPKPDDIIPTYMGHSIGHWEGDTLVVDTIGMNTEPDIQPGVPHTDKLHIVERMKLTPEGFVDQITMDDPNILEQPWVTQKRYKKSDAELEEYHCLPENNHFTVDADGVLRPH